MAAVPVKADRETTQATRTSAANDTSEKSSWPSPTPISASGTNDSAAKGGYVKGSPVRASRIVYRSCPSTTARPPAR